MSPYNVARMAVQEAALSNTHTHTHEYITDTLTQYLQNIMDTHRDKVFAYLANTLSRDKQTQTINPIKLYHGLEKVRARVCVCLDTVAACTPLPLLMPHPHDFTSAKSQRLPASLLTDDANSLNITREHMQTER